MTLSKKFSKHKRALEDIIQYPNKIRIRDVVEAETEVPVSFDGHTLATEIDILFYLNKNIYVPIEYKCNDGLKQRDKAVHQLYLDEKWIKLNYNPFAVLMLYVYGNNLSNDTKEFLMTLDINDLRI